MPVFNTSIQLHYGDEVDYALLDQELKQRAFKPEGQRGDSLKKPSEKVPASARYLREGNVLLQDVVDHVLRAAKKTGKKFSFTVVKNKLS